ncbi:MAG: DNA cytosine methyltransferase, partial [Candidatus Pacebacteria bacterium]|nr:DNA cytosine methyltransferase [Candidatus Paceibacterota bacterium]
LKNRTKKEFQPLLCFSRLISEVKPDIISMENVKGLIKYPVFKKFIKNLEENGYYYDYKIVDTSDYGVPQKRIRLVLLASKLGEIKLINKTHKNKKTVRNVIGYLDPINDGESNEKDPLHHARKLSPLNKKRIVATKLNGGNSKNWPERLQLSCHIKETGKSYRSTVYGRMKWDEPSPTMTTQCIGLGNGRFGHPEQNRAISLREAALLQTFPKYYKFYDPKKKIITSDVARFIGNAVPVRLGQIIAKSINKHLENI